MDISKQTKQEKIMRFVKSIPELYILNKEEESLFLNFTIEDFDKLKEFNTNLISKIKTIPLNQLLQK